MEYYVVKRLSLQLAAESKEQTEEIDVEYEKYKRFPRDLVDGEKTRAFPPRDTYALADTKYLGVGRATQDRGITNSNVCSNFRGPMKICTTLERMYVLIS